jgi:enamine deaminase RidA (YjgF/YER057c/UK114 family)
MNEPQIRFLNRAPAGYSQVVEVRGGHTLYISGQVALDSSGKVVGSDDFTAQVRQVFANLKSRLDEAGASFNDVVKLNSMPAISRSSAMSATLTLTVSILPPARWWL